MRKTYCGYHLLIPSTVMRLLYQKSKRLDAQFNTLSYSPQPSTQTLCVHNLVLPIWLRSFSIYPLRSC